MINIDCKGNFPVDKCLVDIINMQNTKTTIFSLKCNINKSV